MIGKSSITYMRCGENDTWARLDFVLYKEDHIIVLSVDEFQHRDYEVVCDVARMSKVVCAVRQAGDMRNILWLRFNPDTTQIDGENIRFPLSEREKVLSRCIDSSGDLLDNASVVIYYLYYDSFTNQDGSLTAEVTLHPDYSDQWKPLVKGVIVE